MLNKILHVDLPDSDKYALIGGMTGIVDSAMDAVITINEDQVIILFNPAAERMFGCEIVKALGSRIDRFIPQRYREAHAEHIRKFGETGETSRRMGHLGEIVGLRANGEEFPIEASISQVKVGATRLFSVILRDITERKKNEEQLKKFTEELKRSNNDLREFAYVVSHDLKEPLRAINGFMELLRQKYADKLDEKARQYIDIAVNSTKRMDAMLAGLLEYSRVHTHAKPLALTPGQAAFDAAVANLQAGITETHAVITCDPLPPVKADDTQLLQLFQNLIGNAIKFRSEQKPEIHVGCEKQENCLLFSVRDNGIGIAPKAYEQIFFIFQQLNPVERYSGQGIGLAICKKIVERHGGKIWVESQPPKGSTFFFTIPV